MKQFIKWLISSNGLAWATFIIVIAQSFHYASFFYSFDLFNGALNYVYAGFFTIVLAMPLMIFTVKLGNLPLKFGETNQFKKSELEDKYMEAVNLYMYTDILINMYTWYTKLNVFFDFQWILLPKYIMVTLISIILPISLKKFSGEIKLNKNDK
ncbi:MAG: hypothetical protein M0R17_04355 [Candidatus Omnitrophica bacterium]|jgi:hypothetical protein|nr:hypothetical protein [Candidatus Omnitrophota bacterium]